DELQRRSRFYSVDFLLIQCAASDSGLHPVRHALLALLNQRFSRDEAESRVRSKYGEIFGDLLFSTAGSAIITSSSAQLFMTDALSVMSELSTVRPIVLAVDDVHHAGPLTLTFLRQLVFRRSDISGALIATQHNSDQKNWLLNL